MQQFRLDLRSLGRLLLVLALLTSAPDAAAADLGSSAERFAGAPVNMDVRVAQRTCAPGGFRFAWAREGLEARCPSTGERLLLSLAAQSEPVKVRRGESLQADYEGNGFRITVGAVAETSTPGGRMTLRNSRSGQRFGARMDQSGRIIVSESDN